MAQIRLSIGERVNVSEDYQKIKCLIAHAPDPPFIELKQLVKISPANRREPDQIKKESVCININHIVEFY